MPASSKTTTSNSPLRLISSASDGERNKPIGVPACNAQPVAALRAAAGQGAYVVAVIERKDSLTEKTANALSTSKAFAILAGKSVVNKTAVLKTYEFVVIHIPATGKATVVAAAEQLYAASGA